MPGAILCSLVEHRPARALGVDGDAWADVLAEQRSATTSSRRRDEDDDFTGDGMVPVSAHTTGANLARSHSRAALGTGTILGTRIPVTDEKVLCVIAVISSLPTKHAKSTNRLLA
jgi:hypothetical protein